MMWSFCRLLDNLYFTHYVYIIFDLLLLVMAMMVKIMVIPLIGNDDAKKEENDDARAPMRQIGETSPH